MFEIRLIKKEEKELSRKMLEEYLSELYTYDKDIDFDEKGKPIYKYFDFYWTEEGRYPIGLFIDGNVAGFMLLRMKAKNAMEIAEFYIAPNFRKNGNGRVFFNKIMAKINKKLYFFTKKTNIIAKNFWDNAIKEYFFWKGENEECYTWIVCKTPLIQHDLNIREEYFEKIKTGEKLYEGRLFDDKRRNFHEGDIIKFSCGEKSFHALIEERKIFSNFEEMAKNIDKKQLGFKEKTRQAMIETYRSFYSLEDEFKYGVVVFKVFLV